MIDWLIVLIFPKLCLVLDLKMCFKVLRLFENELYNIVLGGGRDKHFHSK